MDNMGPDLKDLYLDGQRRIRGKLREERREGQCCVHNIQTQVWK